MYPQPWQRWAWAALPAISATALTFVPFIVAWRRGHVGWRTLAVYTLLTALTEVDIHQWGRLWREVIRYTAWAYLITGVVHVALLDWPRGKKATLKA
jgi:hypothetical protein